MTVVESLMKTDLVTARAGDTVAQAASSMARSGVGAVLVLEGEALVGVLSERDVLVRIVAEGRDPAATMVADIASTDVVSVDVNASVRECAEQIQAKGIRHLPILRDGRAIGILSSRDFFAYVVEGLEQLVRKGLYKQALADGADPYEHIGGSYGE